MGIGEIKEILNNCSIEELKDKIGEFENDERAGVVKLVESARKKIAAFEKEIERTYHMKEYERKYENCRYICGIDEVGRGPLAGPVVAAAVVLPKDVDIYYLNDSKQLSEKKREALYEEIMEKAVAVGIGFADEKLIDEINILQADYEAMRIALSKLSVKPDILLNDAVTIPGVDIKQESIIKGDAKSVSIAAASIVAKVTRDRFMVEMDKEYPGYGFASNKGYGSAAHIEAIKTIGPCKIHRRSFIGNFI
ncbi:MAG: ribonuclease HII [Lachnospiraceae bacterium]|jgi:ribonuclease HII|nr:ribonuclease HII [Lachnospiraceae bacterium]